MTCDVIFRYKQHLRGEGSKYTLKHGVKRLVYFEEHNNFDIDRYREKQIKDWRREKKQKLINGKWSVPV